MEKPMNSHRPLLLGAVLLLAAGAVLAQTATQMPADINATSRARLPYPDGKNLSEADQKNFSALPGFNKTTGGLGAGPLSFAAYNVGAAKALFDLHNAAVPGSLKPNVRELAIMVACRETNYNLEWNGHEAAAVKAGVDQKVLDIVKNRGALTGLSETDATVIRFGRQLYTDKKVDSATFAKAVELFGQKGVMDMVAVMNTYAVSGFFAIAVDEQPAAGKTPLPK
jgi:4-carboxymuconolactone decarboxylase